ncbi:MAG: hypothetical protein J7465_05525 [Chloroflexus sp.]|nr:hypothetical protein [Chloroflexus sp.]MBO9372529.1 hypothetical protein [Chloroflexus sp.]
MGIPALATGRYWRWYRVGVIVRLPCHPFDIVDVGDTIIMVGAAPIGGERSPSYSIELITR